MQNIFTRVKVKIAEGVGIVAAAKGERDLQKFNTVSCCFARKRRNFSAAAFSAFFCSLDHKKIFIFHGNAEALTDENQTSNFVVSFATAVIKNSRSFFLQLCRFFFAF